MKNFTTTAVCRGCRHQIKVSFDDSENWRYVAIPVDCSNCESELEVQCKRGMIGKGVYTRTKMVKHSEKLLDILAESAPPKSSRRWKR